MTDYSKNIKSESPLSPGEGKGVRPHVVIIKYNAGNIRSVENALGRLGVSANITDDVNQIKAADKVIFPGVGEASTAMNYLKAKGLDE